MLLEAVNYDYYKDKLASDVFEFIIDIDPTSDKKYAQWILRSFFKTYKTAIDHIIDEYPKYKWNYPLTMEMFKSVWDDRVLRHTDIYGFFFEEYITNNIKDNLYDFHILKIKNGFTNPDYKNIMNIPDFRTLSKIISEHQEILEKIQLETFDKSEVEKWYSDSRWVIVSPLTHRAACKYGANTKWCTASKDDPSQFQYHTAEGPLIIIIDKQENTKYQLHMATNQWMDILDEPIEDRSYFIGLLPELACKVLYYKTKNIIFLKDIDKYLQQISSSNEAVTKIMSYVFDEDLIRAWEDAPSNVKYNFPFSKDLLKRAIGEHYFDSGDFDDSSYDYGYQRPWEFIDETPADISKAPKCPECNGEKYVLPEKLPEYTYNRIESGENDFVNTNLNPQEIKFFLSLYKKIDLNGDIEYKLIRDDEEIKNKLKQPCRTCKGVGTEKMVVADYYSEEQRERAAIISRDGSTESMIEETMRSFSSYYHAEQDYGKYYIGKIFDQVITLVSEMPDKYSNDFISIVTAVSQTKDSKGFSHTLNSYIEPFI